jgi:peptide/nickel transport system permease protein
MGPYLIRRTVYLVPTLMGVALIAFTMLKLAGGDPALILAGEDPNPTTVANVRRELGLDEPLPVQFVSFMANAVRGDFGRSFVNRRPVADEIARRYPRTATIALASVLFAVVCGVSLGVVAALYPHSAVDHACTSLALLGVSVPGFWLALMLIYLFSVHLRWLPTLGLDTALDLVLPVLVTGTYSLALLTRMTRAGMLEVLGREYILTARAKGLVERVILLRHALRNALLPLVTVAGLSVGYLLGGTVVTETIFSIDGLGSMIVAGILARDMPVVQSGILVLAANFIVITTILDIMYAYLDPRIRY